MVVRLYGRDVWRPSARASGKMIRVALASAAMGGLVALASHLRPQIEASLGGFHLSAFGPKEITVLLVAAGGGLAYVVLLFALGGVTPAEARTALKRRKGDTPVETTDLP
jgi:putative peptidoglycan lipid II flippase